MVTSVSPIETEKPMQMPFGGRQTREGPNNNALDGGAQWRHLSNATEWQLCGGDAALSQIILATCFYCYNIVSVCTSARGLMAPLLLINVYLYKLRQQTASCLEAIDCQMLLRLLSKKNVCVLDGSVEKTAALTSARIASWAAVKTSSQHMNWTELTGTDLNKSLIQLIFHLSLILRNPLCVLILLHTWSVFLKHLVYLPIWYYHV